MVLTIIHECYANADINSSDIQQAQLKSQTDHLPTTILNTPGIAQPESCTQWSESNEISLRTISHISSNGYYGFTNVNNTVNKGPAENSNDVNTHFGKLELKRHNVFDNDKILVNQIKTFLFNKTSMPQTTKRIHPDGNCTNKLEINPKRCRVETDKLPVLEPVSIMEVDVTEVEKDSNNLHDAANKHRMLTQPPCPSTNQKNYFEKTGLMPGQAQFTARVSALRRNKSPEAYRSLYRSESKHTRINECDGTSQEIPCDDNNKRHLEQMFSETHGSGLFYFG